MATLYRALAEVSLGWRFTATPAGVVAEPTRRDRETLRGVTAIEAAGGKVEVTADLLIESGAFHNEFSKQNAFFAEHARLWQLLQAPEVRVRHDRGVTRVEPAERSLGELGPSFWFPWVVSLLSLSVGLGIWVYQPASSATRCYLIASSGYAAAMLAAATWGSRLLTQPPQGWVALHLASHLASFMVLAGLCALLWLHPRRLGGNWLLWALAAAVSLVIAVDAGQWVPTFAIAYRLPLVFTSVLVAVLYALQWRAARRDPGHRAQLKWFGLLLFAALSIVTVYYAVAIGGRVVLMMPQVYGLGIVALLFVGLVPLVTRVGLFQLEAWWPRAWLWFLGGLLVVVLDLFLLMALDWGADTAFTVALALAGWLYFPLRQTLWDRMARGTLPGTQDVLPQILDLVAQRQGGPAHLNQRWRSLWDDVFKPQRITAVPAGGVPGMAAQGQVLRVEAGPGLEPLELGLPERGARLYSPADAQRAREICDLLSQGLAAAEAFETGAREERRRIASDLHDDMGAHLLHIAQASGTAGRDRLAAMARQALDDMRLSVRGLAGEPALAQDVLADWRAEAVTRLDSAGFAADWLAQEPPPGLVLPARTHVQLTRVLREALSNTLRHSRGTRCRVRIRFGAGELGMTIEDDGIGLPPAAPGGAQGHGLANIERRVRSLQGHYRCGPGEGAGTCLEVTVPLESQSATIEGV